MGRIFAYWAIVYSGHLSINTKVAEIVLAAFFHGKGCAFVLTKNGLGFSLWAIFYSNSHLVTLAASETVSKS
jgi:hypothetical protein